MKLNYIIILLLLSSFGNSQTFDSFTKIIRVKSQTEAQLLLTPNNPKPTDNDFIITDDSLIKIIVTYLTPDLFDESQKTLVIYPNLTREPNDSVLILESVANKYKYVKHGAEWELQHLNVTSNSLGIRNLRVGQSSKTVFKLLHQHTKKKVGDGQIWVMSKDGTRHLELTFLKDKLVRMEF